MWLITWLCMVPVTSARADWSLALPVCFRIWSTRPRSRLMFFISRVV